MAGEVVRARPCGTLMTSYSPQKTNCREVRTHASAYLYPQSLAQCVALLL